MCGERDAGVEGEGEVPVGQGALFSGLAKVLDALQAHGEVKVRGLGLKHLWDSS